MPVIMEGENVTLDDFFDFEQTSHEAAALNPPAHVSSEDTLPLSCIPPVDSSVSLDIGFMNDWNSTDNPPIDSTFTDSLAAFDDFSKFIPRYSKPADPCEYCRSKGLECFITYGCSSCSACNTLFRDCSFVRLKSHHGTGGFFDTLHIVSEDTAQDEGAVTGTKPLFSSGATLSEMRADVPERKSVGRYPKAAVKVLKDWLHSHYENPYPTDEEKNELKFKTGLKRSQISNWLANARRRGKVRPRTNSSGVCPTGTSPIDINIDGSAYMTPFERWRNSPPEHDAASMSAIKRAAVDSDLNPDAVITPQHASNPHNRTSSTGSVRSGWRPASTTSLDTTPSSASLESSLWSHGSRSSYNSFAKKDRRRRRRNAPPALGESSSAQPRNFQCTFCTDTFRTKYDWSRHEKSLHLSSEKWICAPLGPVVTHINNGHKECVYCLEKNPSADHVEGHNHSACEEKGIEARTFYRKDHLRQHLRLVHSVNMHKGMESWMSSPSILKSRCGFCCQTFTTWQSRVDHLAKHFREGVKMSQWKGDWGFEPHVIPMVTNCMPPFLIGMESKTPTPFSATNPSSMRDTALIPRIDGSELSPPDPAYVQLPGGFMANIKDGPLIVSSSSCWEILTVRLGEFVRQQKNLGVPVTDDMLQKYSRILLYGEEDDWNQTAADNVEWLTLFKQSHGLLESNNNTSGTATGGASANTSDFGISQAEHSKDDRLQDAFPYFDFLGQPPVETMATESQMAPSPIQFGDMNFEEFFLHDSGNQ